MSYEAIESAPFVAVDRRYRLHAEDPRADLGGRGIVYLHRETTPTLLDVEPVVVLFEGIVEVGDQAIGEALARVASLGGEVPREAN